MLVAFFPTQQSTVTAVRGSSVQLFWLSSIYCLTQQGVVHLQDHVTHTRQSVSM